MWRLVVLLLLASSGVAQERPKPSPEIQALLDAAPALPAELAADVLLRLADSGRIPSTAQRLEMIEQASRVGRRRRARRDHIPPTGSGHIGFLKTSPMERESPPEWLVHVKRLFSITNARPGHLEHVRAEVRKNGSLAMGLYAELARLDARR